MFLDASIIVAILGREEDWERQLARLQGHGQPYFFTALARFETVIALARLTQAARAERTSEASIIRADAIFDDFMSAIAATEIDISSEIGSGALSAARTYGKMVGHKAGLNFGDCFSYAAAKSLGTGLLYKGTDFAFTDLA